MGLMTSADYAAHLARLPGGSADPSRKPRAPRGKGRAGLAKAAACAAIRGDGITVLLAMDPPTVTHHDKIIGRAGTRPTLRDSDALRAAREAYHKLLLASGRKPAVPMDGPLSLDVVFTFRADDAGWHVVKPDADNMAKVVTDALVDAGFIRMDQRVCDLRARKVTGPVPGVAIVVRRLGPLVQHVAAPVDEQA